jgi:phosphoribosylanthranilate isomerase
MDKCPESQRVRVAICAMRDVHDVHVCAEAGVDSIGVLVGVRHTAEDAVDLALAQTLLGSVPETVQRHAVTHLGDLDGLREIARLPIDWLQLQDVVSTAVARRMRREFPRLRIAKAVHVSGVSVEGWEEWVTIVDALVVDSIDQKVDRIGGTGRSHDWHVSALVRERSGVPVVLAGGLDPSNVVEALQEVRPAAISVNTGVECDGRKDLGKVRALVRAVDQCWASTNR